MRANHVVTQSDLYCQFRILLTKVANFIMLGIPFSY